MLGVIKAQGMFSQARAAKRPDPPVIVARPADARGPLVLASPHSGRCYSAEFLAQAALNPLELRASEDAFVDLLFADAPSLGAPLVSAQFPRAYMDANRHPWELDPKMFADPLPNWIHARTPRVAAGLGSVPRIVADGAEIYRGRLPAAEAEIRVRDFHRPYHNALSALLEETRERFGAWVLVDCHSMPSAGHERIDAVLGDRYGSSCAGVITDTLENALRDEGLRVARNTPYAGGYSTESYGDPERSGHAIQLELNRALYMDEQRVRVHGGFPAMRKLLCRITERMARAYAELQAGLPKKHPARSAAKG